MRPYISRHKEIAFEFTASGVRPLPNSRDTLIEEQSKIVADDVYNKCIRTLEHLAHKLSIDYSSHDLRLGSVRFVLLETHSGQPGLITKGQYEGASEYGHTPEDMRDINYLEQMVKEGRAQKVKIEDVTFYRLLATEERVEVIPLHQSHLKSILHYVDPGLKEAREDSNYNPAIEISLANMPTNIYKKVRNLLGGTTNRDLAGVTGEKGSWDHWTSR
jgi:hypothetical protein